MDFLNEIENNSILVIPYNIKDKLLEYIDTNNIINNFKIITFNDLKKGLMYDYNNETIYNVMKHFNLNYAISKNYINDTYYINDDDNDKMNFLRSIKNYLSENNLLIKDELFKSLLKSKNKLYVFGFDYINKFNQSLLEIAKSYIEITYINKNSYDYKHDVYGFTTIDDEVSFIAEEISKLIDNNIPLNKIFIANYSDEYYFSFKRIFAAYNIPYFIKNETTIYTTNVGKYFIENLDNNKELMLYRLRNKFGNDNLVVQKISSLLNTYYWCENICDARDLLVEEIKTTKIPSIHYKEEIKTVNLSDNLFSDDEYVFLIGFNLGVIPKLKRDEDYLSDDIKPNVLETTSEYNNIIKNNYITILKNIKNITITYKLTTPFNSYYPSFLIDGDYLVDKKVEFKLSKYSNQLNKINYAKKIDNLIKFNEKSNELEILNNTYTIDYNTYNNQFTGVDNSLLINTINDKLNFSYSNISTYNECPFKFYLSNVLNIRKYEQTSEQFIGSLFHHVLEKCLDNYELDIDKVYDEYIESTDTIELTNSDTFFINFLKKEIHFIIETIREQYKHSKHEKTLHEKKLEIECNNKIKTKVKGFVDKLLVLNNSVIIIDYKTNNTMINPDLFQFGLSFQLPIYLYLLKELDSNIEVAGMYMQHILNLKSEFDPSSDYLEEKKKQLKLSGITIKDIDLISNFDDTYEKSEVIYGVRVLKKTGDLQENKRVITKEQRDDLLELVKSIINITIDNVCDGNFDIKPIKIYGQTDGCQYCEYKDVCYRKYKDFNIQEIKKDSKGSDNDE